MVSALAAIDKDVRSIHLGNCDVTFHQGDIQHIHLSLMSSGGADALPECSELNSVFEVHNRTDASSADVDSTSNYFLDHFALNSRKFRDDVSHWSKFLATMPALDNVASWSAGDNAVVRATHFYRPGAAYITIRDFGGGSVLDHIGFRCVTEASVLAAFKLLSGVGWQALGEPAVVDHSLLFHFQGPDGRAHDFFFPTLQLAT